MSIFPKTSTDNLWRAVCLTLFVLGVVGYPMVAFLAPALDLGDTRFVSIPFRAMVLGLSFTVLLRWATRIVQVSFPYVVCFGLFWCLYLFRLAADAVPGRLSLLPWGEYWLFALGVSSLPALAALVLPPRLLSVHIHRFLLFVFAVSALGNGLVILAHFRAGDVARLSHEALNPISLGHVGASLGLLALAGIARGSGAATFAGDSRGAWLTSPLLLLLGFVSLIASASRGPLLAFLMAFGVLLAREVSRGRVGRVFVTAVLCIGTAGLATSLADRFGIQFLARMGSLAAGRDVTLSMRLERWEVSWRSFLENPILGSGLDTPALDYPHNVVIEAFMSTGLVGGFLFCALLIMGLANSLRLVWGEGPAWWLGLLTIQFIVGALVSGTLYSNASMWFTLSAVMALASPVAASRRSLAWSRSNRLSVER